MIQKGMILFGLFWLFVWCAVGLYLGAQHGDHGLEMLTMAQDGDLEGYWQQWEDWKGRAVSHTHGLCLATLVLILALLLPFMGYSDLVKGIMGGLFILGSILQPVFGWFDIVVGMVMGASLILAMLLMAFIGMIKGFDH